MRQSDIISSHSCGTSSTTKVTLWALQTQVSGTVLATWLVCQTAVPNLDPALETINPHNNSLYLLCSRIFRYIIMEASESRLHNSKKLGNNSCISLVKQWLINLYGCQLTHVNFHQWQFNVLSFVFSLLHVLMVWDSHLLFWVLTVNFLYPHGQEGEIYNDTAAS